MNLIALVGIVDLVLAYLEATWRRCARIMGTRTLNVAYVLVLVVLSSWLLLASLTRVPRIRVQRCRHKHSLNDNNAYSYQNNERSKLYENMAAELGKKGPVFLGKGETSQSLKLSELFSVVKGKIVPIHKAANPPVRAVVLYLDPNAAHEISRTVKSVLSPHFPESGVWYQDPEMYHFSMHHASHHQNPVPATSEEVLEGTEPSVLREELRKALPRSPENQVYNPAIFYTSFARVLSPPITAHKDQSVESMLEIFQELVYEVNRKLCSKATVKELWYVEELDILALAFKGKTRIKRFKLQPQHTHSEGVFKEHQKWIH